MQRALFSTPLSREMLQAISSSSCFQTCPFQPTLSFPQREKHLYASSETLHLQGIFQQAGPSTQVIPRGADTTVHGFIC